MLKVSHFFEDLFPWHRINRVPPTVCKKESFSCSDVNENVRLLLMSFEMKGTLKFEHN